MGELGRRLTRMNLGSPDSVRRQAIPATYEADPWAALGVNLQHEHVGLRFGGGGDNSGLGSVDGHRWRQVLGGMRSSRSPRRLSTARRRPHGEERRAGRDLLTAAGAGMSKRSSRPPRPTSRKEDEGRASGNSSCAASWERNEGGSRMRPGGRLLGQPIG